MKKVNELLQVLELTQGQKMEVEVLAVLVQRMQESRQQHNMDGKDTPGKSQLSGQTSCPPYLLQLA